MRGNEGVNIIPYLLHMFIFLFVIKRDKLNIFLGSHLSNSRINIKSLIKGLTLT